MDLQNIQDQLHTEFSKEDTRIIFWFDDKGEYEDEVLELQLDNAKLHILDGTNWFYSKWLLNESDTKSKYLVYAPFPKPSDAENRLELITGLKNIWRSTVTSGKTRIVLRSLKSLA